MDEKVEYSVENIEPYMKEVDNCLSQNYGSSLAGVEDELGEIAESDVRHAISSGSSPEDFASELYESYESQVEEREAEEEEEEALREELEDFVGDVRRALKAKHGVTLDEVEIYLDEIDEDYFREAMDNCDSPEEVAVKLFEEYEEASKEDEDDSEGN
jgi:uncharacterized protein (DUF1778 family)